jgi:hypothetical protein
MLMLMSMPMRLMGSPEAAREMERGDINGIVTTNEALHATTDRHYYSHIIIRIPWYGGART